MTAGKLIVLGNLVVDKKALDPPAAAPDASLTRYSVLSLVSQFLIVFVTFSAASC